MDVMKEVSVLETVSVRLVFLIKVFDNTGLQFRGRQMQFLLKNKGTGLEDLSRSIPIPNVL